MIPISHILEKYLGSSLLYTNIVEIMIAALIDILLKEKERIFIRMVEKTLHNIEHCQSLPHRTGSYQLQQKHWNFKDQCQNQHSSPA